LGKRLPPEKVECVVRGLREGKQYVTVARECGVSLGAVGRYAKMLKSGELGGPSQPSAPARPIPVQVERWFEDERRMWADLIRGRVDPKSPLFTKILEEPTWLMRFLWDYMKLAVPDSLRLVSRDEVERYLDNPEGLAKLATARLSKLIQDGMECGKRVAEVEERLRQARAEIEELKAENRELKKLLDEYATAIRELGEKVRGIKAAVQETAKLVLVDIPRLVSEADRAKVVAYARSRMKQIWGGAG